jgi:2,3,4,5-tetrahydropyridine-2-carboxylate N-succinyltransferase
MMTLQDLRQSIEQFSAQDLDDVDTVTALHPFLQLRTALETGVIRSAEPDDSCSVGWRVNTWVKRGILLGFRLGTLQSMNGEQSLGNSILSFVEKSTFPVRHWSPADGVRIVPGGSSVRSGAHLAPGVIVAPPAFINVGAFVGEGSMID